MWKRTAAAILAAAAVTGCFTRYQRPLPPASDEASGAIHGVRLYPAADRPDTTIHFAAGTQAVLVDSGLIAVRPPNDTVFFPRDEIDQLVHRRFSPLKTAMVPVALAGGLALVALASSCPILYVDDGTAYHAVAEPLGGAITAGLARTDVSELEHLQPVDGEYRMIIANELEETQHLDALSLLVADHPAGTRVVADRHGRLFLLDATEPPNAATTRAGSEAESLARTDGLRWTPHAGESVREGGPVRDTLILTFRRPAGDEALLVVRAGTSEQGALTLKRMLELWGEEVGTWYAMLDGSPEVRTANEDWVLREELWALKVAVQEGDEWVEQDVLTGGGPLITEAQAVPLDLRRIVGDTLRIRLRPPRGFWTFDYVALQPGPLAEVRGREITVGSARFADADVSEALAREDGNDLRMDRRGDLVHVTFEAPPHPPEQARTIFARTRGFYRIHLDAHGPRQSALDSLWLIPGEPSRFAAGHAAGARVSP